MEEKHYIIKDVSNEIIGHLLITEFPIMDIKVASFIDESGNVTSAGGKTNTPDDEVILSLLNSLDIIEFKIEQVG